MAGEFKQCPNGHYYQETSCPYCKTKAGNTENYTSLKTEAFVDNVGTNNRIPTEIQNDGERIRTTVSDEKEPVVSNDGRNVSHANRTVFGDESEIEVSPTGQQIEKKVYRISRKLVGWLVTYSFDAMGVDFKLYEGKNNIGRDIDCSITVNDNMMSGKHATLLFRDGQYALKDEMSSHGTLVNDKNIGFETYMLKDGDRITIGETKFKFRTSL